MNRSKLVFIVPLIIISLLLALWSGLLRIGWDLPAGTAAPHHGALMVNSFLASVIFLERAITFKQKWVLLLPFINAASSIFFVTGFIQTAYFLLIAGSVGFTLICQYFLFSYKHFYYVVFVAGAVCLFTGNIILLVNKNYADAVYWWIGFFVFTIVAERLELSRFLKLTSFKRALLIGCLLGVSVALCLQNFSYSDEALAISFALTAAWLVMYDMARYSIKRKGQHRYSGLLLLIGFGWLFITGVLLLCYSTIPFAYDAILHSFFIGFVFSMIFSHAPIILPAVTKLPIKIYRPALYIWFVLLQLSLLLRIIADINGNTELKKLSGGLNGIIILLFFISVGLIVKQESANKARV